MLTHAICNIERHCAEYTFSLGIVCTQAISRVDLFENAVFMLSCGRVKTELFVNAGVTTSIYDVSEHAHGSLGITQGHFDCLFDFFKVPTAKFECSSVFVWTGIVFKTLPMWILYAD